MNKTAKKSIIWGTTAAAIAGITVGITVPAVKASNKVTNTSPINMNPNDDSQMNAGVLTNNNGATTPDANLGITVKQLVNSVDNAGIKDTTLLTKLQYQLSFYLYNQEQEGSLQLQRMYFQWDLYSFNKRVRDMIKNDLHENTDTYTLNATKDLFDTLTTKAKQIIDQKLTATPAPSDEEKALLNGYKSTLDTIKNDWTNKQKQIDAIDNKSVNYDSATFSTDYSKTLLPLKNIRDKQVKIFGDTKASFMAGYSSAAEGNAEWQKQLSSKYNGATNDSQAIDYLVNQQVAASAWNKYKFSINKDFTFEQYKSNIFKNILGTATADANGIYPVVATAGSEQNNRVVFRKVTNKDDYRDTDKVFFFGTATKIPSDPTHPERQSWMNISGYADKVSKVFGNQSHIMQVQNAILGFKQGADKNSPWTVTKEQLTKLFSAFTTTATNNPATRAVDQWQNIFANGQDELTKTLISTFSDTTDATQWKSGNLGWQTQLSALGNYYEGFSLGIASALDDFTGGHNFGGAVHGSAPIVTGGASTNFLGDLMDVMRQGLVDLGKAKGWTLPTISATSTASEITDYNREIASLLSTLSDSDIAQNFGKAINNFFMGINVNTDGKVVAAGTGTTALHGLPSTIRLDAGTTSGTGIFLVNTDQPAGGIHIIKVTTGTAAIAEMKKEFQEDVDTDKQDASKIVTDWGKFITDSYSQVTQFQDVLGVNVASADDKAKVKGLVVDDTAAAALTKTDNTKPYTTKAAWDAEVDGTKSLDDLKKLVADFPSLVAPIWSAADKVAAKLNEIQTVLRTQYKDNNFDLVKEMGYSDLGMSILAGDLTNYLTSQKNSEGLARVQSAYRDGLFTWLQTKIDKGLWTEGFDDHSKDFTITPDEIYKTLLAAEGIL